MPRPAHVDIQVAAKQLAAEVSTRLDEGASIVPLRNILGEASVKKFFSVGSDSAKRIHQAAILLLKESGFAQFHAATASKQVMFCKAGCEAMRGLQSMAPAGHSSSASSRG